MQRTRRGATHISRRDFLRLGGAGLAGAALLGTAGCGGGSQSSGNEVIFSWGEDDPGVLPGLIEEFNKQNEGNIKVTHRVMPSDTGQYFDQIRTEFQAGGGDIDVIGGDVIWPAQFAANGYILDLSDRFTDTDAFLPGPIQSNTYDGKVWGVPWYTDAGLLYYRQDLLEQAGFSEGPKTWEEPKEMALKTALCSRAATTRAACATVSSTSVDPRGRRPRGKQGHHRQLRVCGGTPDGAQHRCGRRGAAGSLHLQRAGDQARLPGG